MIRGAEFLVVDEKSLLSGESHAIELLRGKYSRCFSSAEIVVRDSPGSVGKGFLIDICERDCRSGTKPVVRDCQVPRRKGPEAFAGTKVFLLCCRCRERPRRLQYPCWSKRPMILSVECATNIASSDVGTPIQRMCTG